MPLLKKHFSLSPLNDSPVIVSGNVVQGGFSHKDGFPTIRFSLPAQNTLLETSTLKLVGQFIIKKDDQNVLDDQVNLVNTNLNNGADLEYATAVNIPNWGGIKNVIDKVVIQSKKSQVELTSAINYAQYESLHECYTHNEDDYRGSPLSRNLTSGKNSEFTNRRMVRSADPALQPAIADANDKNIGQFFSISINLDLLNNLPLHLGMDYLGGALITIHLAPDSNVLCNRHRDTSVADQPLASSANGSNYVLKNLKLEGRYLIPSQQDLEQYPNAVMLKSRLNLINDVQSSINSNSYTPQLSMVKSIMNLYQDQNQPNNFSKNMNNFRYPTGTKALQQAKNGLRFPLDFKVPVVPNFETTDMTASATLPITAFETNNLHFPVLGMGEAEIRKQFDKSLLNGIEPYHSSATFELMNNSLIEDYASAAAGVNGNGNNMRPNCVGLGVDYTFNMGNIQNFQNQDYNLQLESGVNTGNALLPASRNGATVSNPHLQQTFIKHLSPFSLQTLVKTM
tara:strand:+ start:2934 stop:4463 length:1530 start_codon:yes stop_codon:yes gene_type:complete